MLDKKHSKGGISRMYVLPPILRMVIVLSIQMYSKDAQGILDLGHVLRICTENSISLSPHWRQWGNRYVFHAGQELAGNEFRYFMIVIVTTAVY